METPAQFDLWRDAIPGAEFAVFELRADESIIRERLVARGDSLGFEEAAERSRELAEILRDSCIASHYIDTDGLSKPQVAAQILELSGWE